MERAIALSSRHLVRKITFTLSKLVIVLQESTLVNPLKPDFSSINFGRSLTDSLSLYCSSFRKEQRVS